METGMTVEELRHEFNCRVKTRFKQTHTPQCKKCMVFKPWPSGGLHVHHIKALLDGGDNSEENMVVLCGRCHMEYHTYHDGRDFKDWVQEVPAWMFDAIQTCGDPSLFVEYVGYLAENWWIIKEKRMLVEPFDTPEKKKYVEEHSSEWVDW